MKLCQFFLDNKKYISNSKVHIVHEKYNFHKNFRYRYQLLSSLDINLYYYCHLLFKWDEATKGFILSSLFCEYVASMLPAGILTHIFSVKVLLFIAMFRAALSAIITPFVALLRWGYVCAFRVINGLFQGFIFPLVYNLMAKWVHPSERGFSVILHTGSQLGIFFMYAMSGSIIASSMGWPGIFYVSGGLGIAWTLVWFIYGANSPAIIMEYLKKRRYFWKNQKVLQARNAYQFHGEVYALQCHLCQLLLLMHCIITVISS